MGVLPNDLGSWSPVRDAKADDRSATTRAQPVQIATKQMYRVYTATKPTHPLTSRGWKSEFANSRRMKRPSSVLQPRFPIPGIFVQDQRGTFQPLFLLRALRQAVHQKLPM
ncbi:uncharacterized protein FFNC_14215 [Fusarium fujikuroi]|nr:uncharacterized protein FFNC_14215 [Fusarium fujikuroi]